MKRRLYISPLQKRMFLLAFLTAFFAVFTQVLAVTVDNVIVCAFYGEREIAAVNLAGPFFYLLEIPAAGLGAGLQAVCAKELGAGQIDRVNRRFSQIFLLGAVLLAGLSALVFFGAEGLAVLFGARGNTAELRPHAAAYLRGLSLEILPYVLFCLTSPIVILDNGGKLISLASFCGCFADVVLDLLSVRFGWGLWGIGLASSASALVYFGVTMLHFLRRDRVIRLRPTAPRRADLKEILVYSRPQAVLCLGRALSAALYIFLASVTGGVAGACVLSVHVTVSYFVAMVGDGASGALGILAGICCGEKNGEELEGFGALAQGYCLLLSLPVAGVLALIARPLSTALAESPATAELMVFALRCVIVTAPFSFLVHARIRYLQAVGSVRAARRMALSADLLLPAVTCCLLALLLGVHGVFLAFPATAILTLLYDLIWHQRRSGRLLPTAAAYLEVDGSFYPGPGDLISYPIRSEEDCALAAEQAALFCRGHKLPERQAFLVGLCTEELTTNALEHGLQPGQALRDADLRLVLSEGDVILRLRDRGRPFNLREFADRLAAEDKAPDGPGLRILLHAAKDLSYYRTYGMNTTILRL